MTQPAGWGAAAAKLKKGLEQERCEFRLDVNDFESFRAALDDLFKRYVRKNVSRIVIDRIGPHFDHLRSFERAISVGAQNNEVASLIWRGAQAIIEVYTHSSESAYEQWLNSPISSLRVDFPIISSQL